MIPSKDIGSVVSSTNECQQVSRARDRHSSSLWYQTLLELGPYRISDHIFIADDAGRAWFVNKINSKYTMTI